MSFDIAFRAGDYLCPKDKPDLGHFLEHLVLKANADYPSHKEFSRALHAKGGTRDAYAGIFNVCYQFDTPDPDWSRMFDLMLSAVSKPLFLSGEFKSEKLVIGQEHKGYLDDRAGKIEQIVLQRIGRPSARADERLACLESISIDDIKNHYQMTHTSSNARVLVAGHLPLSRRQSIEQRLSGLDLPPGEGRLELPSGKLEGVGMIYRPEAKLENARYFLSFVERDLVLTIQEKLILEYLLSSILLHGDDSWIIGQARHEGLIYNMSRYFDSTATSTNFDFHGQASPDKLERLIDIILAGIDRLLAGDLSTEEIAYCKDYATGFFQMYHATSRDWIDTFSYYYLDSGDIFSVDIQSQLESVGKEEIVGVAHKVFGSFDWTLGLLGKVPTDTRQRIEDKLNRHKSKQ